MKTIAALLCLMAGFLASPEGFARIRLFTSVVPLSYFAERVGGDHVLVESMVQPGHSPVTYEPTTRQMASLAQASAYVRVGVPFESVWMDRISATNPGLMIVDAREGVDLLPMPAGPPVHGLADEAEHDHGAEGLDPHIWLDPTIAAGIAVNIRDYLMLADPDNAGAYEENSDRLVAELADLDNRIRSLIAQGKSRRFLTFHPAWGYFARAYGLEQLAVEHEGKAPGPRTLARLVGLAESGGIGTIFVQKQFNDRTANTLAAEMGAELVVLDPLAADYTANLLSAARAIAGVSSGATESSVE